MHQASWILVRKNQMNKNMELTVNCIIERKEKRLMAELTAESTFSECAEFYLNNKLLTADEGMEAVRQKTKCSISIYPAIGHVSINNLNYSECISLFSECEKWSCVVWPSLADSTKRSYISTLNNRIYPYIGDNKAQESLNFDSIQNLINNLAANKYQEKSMFNAKVILSGVIDYAIQNRILFVNPMKNIRIPKTQIRSFNILSLEKMRELLRIVPKYENGNAFAICILSAMRLGECWGLSISDIDIDNCSINIHQQLQKGKIIPRTKNGLSRKIVLPKAAIPFMKAEQEKRNREQHNAGDKWNNKYNLFFTGKNGKPVNMKKLHAEFKLMMIELGIDNIRIHDLRHSMATAIVNLTGDIYEAQRYLCHLHVRTTKLYLHSTVESQKKLQDELNRIFESY